MRPPEAPVQTDQPPAVFSCPDGKLEVLKNRIDYLACARARKAPAPAFQLQARRRDGEEGGTGIRVGFTASKKVGNAVARNRAKRRMRALARAVLLSEGKPGWDYVLVARPSETTTRDYAAMEAELRETLKKIHAPRKTS
ncbi:MAG: ribonuclease P protein component [Maritimibacter sp.]